MRKFVIWGLLLTLYTLPTFAQKSDTTSQKKNEKREKSEKSKTSTFVKSEVSFYAMPGISTLMYSTRNDLKSTGSFSIGGGLGYSFWFNRYVGLGTGLQFNYYTGNLKFDNFSESLSQTDDSDGTPRDYTITQTINGTETQRASYLEIPLYLRFAVPIGKSVDFLVNVGAGFGLNLFEKTGFSDGAYTRVLRYEGDVNVEISESESFHLGTFTEYKRNPSLPENQKSHSWNLFLMGDLGAKIKVSPRVGVLLLATGSYGLKDLRTTVSPAENLVSENYYGGVTATNYVGSVKSFSIGAKVGVSIALGKLPEPADIRTKSEVPAPAEPSVLLEKKEVAKVDSTASESERKIAKVELRRLLAKLQVDMTRKKIRLVGTKSQSLPFDVQAQLEVIAQRINTSNAIVVITCKSCKYPSKDANQSFGSQRAQSAKKVFINFGAKNSLVRIKVAPCSNPQQDGDISFATLENGQLLPVLQTKSKAKSKKSSAKKGKSKKSGKKGKGKSKRK